VDATGGDIQRSYVARRRALVTIYFNGGSMTAGEIAAIFEHAW
jgi:hypothetical protein